jgi:hypothetical protein
MKKLTILCCFIILIIPNIHAQNNDFLSTREEPFRGFVIKQGNNYLKRKEVAERMRINEEALGIFNLATNHRTAGLISAWLGSAGFVYSLIRIEQGKNAMPLLVGSSILVIPSPYFLLSHRNKDREAIDLYNFSQCCPTGSRQKIKYEFSADVFPPRLSMRFK